MTDSSERPVRSIAAAREIIAPAGHWQHKRGFNAPHGVKVGNTVYVGGQISLSPGGEVVGPDDIQSQTGNVFENLVAVLREAGTDMRELMKLHTYYRYRGDNQKATEYWERMTQVRLKYLANPGPAATAVRVEGVPTSDQMIGVDGFAIIGGNKRRIMPKHTWDWSIPTPFSQGWRVDNKIILGGQISADMKGKAVAVGDVVAQTRNILEFIHHILIDGGGNWGDLVTLKICFKHAGNDKEARALLDRILDVVRKTIPEPRPALHAFGVDLLYEGLVLEIDGYAVLGEKRPIAPAGSETWVSTPGFPKAWKAGSEIYIGGTSAPGGAGLEAQTEGSLERIRRILMDAGAEFGDLVKLTVFYIADRHDQTGDRSHQVVAQVLGEYLPPSGPVVTIVRVPGLSHEGQLVEIDGIAVPGTALS